MSDAVQSALFGNDLFGAPVQRNAVGVLAEKFLFPPFSVLNARAGEWQERKRGWISVGIKSEVGRDAKAYNIGMYANPENGWALEDGISNGTSIFDPVLAECLYRWFTAPGWQVVDPFAGGSVRGIVAGILGRKYWGSDLRREQIEANDEQGDAIIGPAQYSSTSLTPVQRRGDVFLKRDDLFTFNGARGGKVRTCLALASKATKGLTTAGSRSSPQAMIVASVGRALGLPVVIHTPEGDISSGPVAEAVRIGAQVVQHPAGYNSVIVARAREYAAEHGFTEIPFGMECEEAVTQTRRQVANLPAEINRIIVPVGSGMSLAGLLWGLRDADRAVPVIGIRVGADPTARLDRYAPPDWRSMVTLETSEHDYSVHLGGVAIGDVELDPVYEAKAAGYVQPGDLFWIVGHRERADVQPPTEYVRPEWVVGDSMKTLDSAPDADFIFSCPPYGDLEVYSDDPADLSNMEWHTFEAAYKRIILRAAKRLKENRFASFVVGDFRDGKGNYRDFVSLTIQAFRDFGMHLYNEAILVSPIGSSAVRVSKQFEKSRKMVKLHQNVLVFVKGDAKRATAEINALEGKQ